MKMELNFEIEALIPFFTVRIYKPSPEIKLLTYFLHIEIGRNFLVSKNLAETPVWVVFPVPT